MPSLAVDTHAALWYLVKSPKLTREAQARLQAAFSAGRPVFLPSICIVEVTYLVEKGRIPLAHWKALDALLAADDSPFQVVPLDEAIARAVSRIPRSQVPDMPDRIIAATALHLGVPLVSGDRRIRSSALEVIW